MATITSAGSGNWGTGATWVGGVAPADNDSVVIASGHSVVFNVDTSAWANGIAGITITGTLSVNTAASSYMKMKAATTISGAGTFNVGTSGTPIPFAVKFTLTGGSGWYVQGSGGLTMGVYGAEPQYKYVKLTGAETAGATRLEIDTDLTGDIWAATDTIYINNVNKNNNSESRVISAITSTYIDITAGLTGAKIVGSYILLITRNIKFLGVSANVLQNFGENKLIFASGLISSDSSSFTGCTKTTISGGVFTGNAFTYAANSCSELIISGGVFSNHNYGLYFCSLGSVSGGIFSGINYAIHTSAGKTISGATFCGNSTGIYLSNGITISNITAAGNAYAIATCNGLSISGGIFSGNSYGVGFSDLVLTGTTFSANTYDINSCRFNASNQALTSTVENYNYQSFSRNTYSESIDHDQSAGAFKSWTRGGVTTSVATPIPTGFTRSYQLALENASVEGFFNRRVNVPAGKTITLTLYLRKSKAMTYLPRVWVHKYGTEPFTTAGDILHTFTMTDSTNTWESDTYSWTNSGDFDVELNCRFVGMNATGYVYGQVADTFAGGGVSKSRIIGGV